MVRYWATESARWDHTAKHLHMLNMLMSMVAALGGGTIKVLNESDFHPYVDGEQQSNRGKITKENFKVLKMIGDNFVRGGHG